MGGNYFVLILVLTPYLCSAVEVLTVNRTINDNIQYNLKACSNHSTEISSIPVVCRCYANHSTIMSGIGETYLCGAPSEVGCNYSLHGSNQTYLIKSGGNFLKKITPSLPTNDSYMQILIWNYLYNGSISGTWHNITTEASATFSVKSNKEGDFLVISNIEMDLWGAHVIMIKFGSKACLTVKFNGAMNYPFEIDKFKGVIPQTITSKPTTNLQITTKIMKATTTTATTTKRTTAGTTTSPTQPTTTATTTASTSKGITTATTTPTISKRITTATTTASTSKRVTTATITPTTSKRITTTTITTTASTSKRITTATITPTSNTTSSNTTSVLQYPKKKKKKMIIYIVVPLIALVLLLVLALVIYKKIYKATKVEPNNPRNRTEMKDI